MNTITPTITDDGLSGLPPLPNHTILGPAGTGSYFNGHTDAAMIAWGRAVLALAEQRSAAKVAELEAQAAQPAQVAAPTQAPLADKETIRNACRALDPEDACGWSFEQGWRAAEAAMLAAAPKREGGATEGVDWTLQTR